MRVSTQDPISLNRVSCPNIALSIVEGAGSNATRLYFESEANLELYRAIPLPGVGKSLPCIRPRTTSQHILAAG